MKNNKGFTLIELLIVVTILGIIAVIAIPGYIGMQRRAARSEAFTNLESLRLLEEQFFAETADYTPSRGVAGADQPGNVALIQTDLPGFQPGTNLQFSYQTVHDKAINTPLTNPPTWTADQVPCFTAIATGNTNSRVAGETYAIDCNNNKNF